MTAKPIELILFDIDGTLVMTKGAGRTATKLAMLDVFGTAAGIDTHHFGGKTDWRTLHELLADRAYSHDELRGFIPQYEAAIGGHLERIIGNYAVTPCPAANAMPLRVCPFWNCPAPNGMKFT